MDLTSPGAPDLDSAEVARRYRKIWLRQILIGPCELLLMLAFLVARSYWGGWLYDISPQYVAFAVVAAGIVPGLINFRCPNCRKVLRSWRVDRCPGCGVAFDPPVRADDPLQPSTLWALLPRNRAAIAGLVAVVCMFGRS